MNPTNNTFERECFVVMPIGTKESETAIKFNEIYSYLIKPTVEETGFACVRADEILKPGSIIEDIVEHLTKSNVVIADLTGQNPNVFYEVGVRDALKGRMILLAQSIADVPFDLRGYRVVIYDVTSPKGFHEAKEKIKTYLRELASDQELKGSTVRDFLLQKGLEQLTAEPSITDRERELAAVVRDLHAVVSNIQSANSQLLNWLGDFENSVKIGKTLSESITTSLQILGSGFFDDVRRKLSELKDGIEKISKREDISKLTDEFGLVNIYRNRLDALEHDFYRIMENERKQIDIVGSTLFGLKGHSWVTPNRIIQMLKTKKTDPNFVLRIILTHYEYLSFRQEQERLEKRPDRWVISREAIDAVDILKKEGMLNCVRFYRGAPTCFTIVCHDQGMMLLNPYPYEREAFNSWCLVIRSVPTGIYNEFLISHVDKPWVNELLTEPYSEEYQNALNEKYQKDLDAFVAEIRGEKLKVE